MLFIFFLQYKSLLKCMLIYAISEPSFCRPVFFNFHRCINREKDEIINFDDKSNFKSSLFKSKTNESFLK